MARKLGLAGLSSPNTEPVSLPDPEALLCPACAGSLRPYAIEGSGLLLDICSACHGLWFDRAELKELLDKPQWQADFRIPQTAKRTLAAKSLRECPRCESRALAPRETGGVCLEECQGCQGIWLDTGEVTRLIAAQPEAQGLVQRLLGAFAKLFG